MIRRLGPGDADIFRAIRLEALREEPAAFASALADWRDLPRAEWERRLTAPVFVSFEASEPVGMIGLMVQSASKMAHRATVIMVYVRRAHRRRGHAAALFGAVLEHARHTGLRQLELAVSTENPAAVRFYQRMGFDQVGRIPPDSCTRPRDRRIADDPPPYTLTFPPLSRAGVKGRGTRRAKLVHP